MKYIRITFSIILICVILSCLTANALAANVGFSVEDLTEQEVSTFIKNIALSLFHEETEKMPVNCFDVNDNGEIAVGYESFENKTVCVYSSDGAFQYGYTFKCEGSFGIEFGTDSLMIYFVRSSVSIAVNDAGEIESVVEINNSAENNTYWNKSVFSTNRRVGDTVYRLENDMGFFNAFATSYSLITATAENGSKTVVYEAESSYFLSTVVIFIGVLALVCLAVVILTKNLLALKRNN